MLKVSLTDGKTTVHGVEVTKIDGINLNTLPGTKVKLAESIPISNGFLRLEPGTLKVLGGRVESLIEKWETSQKMAKFTRNFARNQPSGSENQRCVKTHEQNLILLHKPRYYLEFHLNFLRTY